MAAQRVLFTRRRFLASSVTLASTWQLQRAAYAMGVSQDPGVCGLIAEQEQGALLYRRRDVSFGHGRGKTGRAIIAAHRFAGRPGVQASAARSGGCVALRRPRRLLGIQQAEQDGPGRAFHRMESRRLGLLQASILNMRAASPDQEMRGKIGNCPSIIRLTR